MTRRDVLTTLAFFQNIQRDEVNRRYEAQSGKEEHEEHEKGEGHEAHEQHK